MTDTLHRPTARVLDILHLLSATPTDGLTLTEIASAIAAPKSSIVPVVRTMAEKKYLSRSREDGRYTVGISTFLAGNAYTNANAALTFIRDEMQEIVSRVNEICHLGVLDNTEVLYIAKVDSRDPIRVISHVGKRLPLYCTALGKALICDWGRQELEQLRRVFPDGFPPVTPKTILSMEGLAAEIETVRSQGLATDNEEVSEHLQCRAVPLRSRGRVIAALSISLPSFRMTPEKEALIRTTLEGSKRKIEAYLETIGFTGASLIDSQPG